MHRILAPAKNVRLIPPQPFVMISNEEFQIMSQALWDKINVDYPAYVKVFIDGDVFRIANRDTFAFILTAKFMHPDSKELRHATASKEFSSIEMYYQLHPFASLEKILGPIIEELAQSVVNTFEDPNYSYELSYEINIEKIKRWYHDRIKAKTA